MIKLRKHIALLLFGSFFFSIIFQSVHVIRHHSNTHKCEHNLCSQTLTNTDFHSNGENVLEREKTCPICEYQFSINDLPKISFFNAVIPVFVCTYNEVTTQQQYKPVFSDKTPRAPPVLIS